MHAIALRRDAVRGVTMTIAESNGPRWSAREWGAL
jgi:hypothetical protein